MGEAREDHGGFRRRLPGPPVPNWVRPQTGGMPRWVKVFAVIGAVLAVLVVVMLLTGHGPGRHLHHGLPRMPAAAVAAR